MKITTELFFECYNFYRNKNHSHRTLEVLRSNLEPFYTFFTYYYGNGARVCDITHKFLEDYKTELSETIVPKFSQYSWQQRFLSPKTIQMRIQAVKNFLRFTNFIYNEGIDYRTIAIPRITNRHINFLEEDEVYKLLKVVDECEKTPIGRQRSKLLITLWYTTGLRLSELLNLTVDEVLDWKAVIRGKWGRERVVFFTPKVQELLREYLELLKRPSYQTGKVLKRKCKEKWVFVSHNAYNFGCKLSKESVCWLFKKYNEKLHLPGKKITCHSLRHSFATRLMDKGINLREIQELMGHADIKTTEAYTHVRNPQLEQSHKLAFQDF